MKIKLLKIIRYYYLYLIITMIIIKAFIFISSLTLAIFQNHLIIFSYFFQYVIESFQFQILNLLICQNYVYKYFFNFVFQSTVLLPLKTDFNWYY